MLQKLLISALFLAIFAQVNSLECYNCTSRYDANCETVNRDTATMKCPDSLNGTEVVCVQLENIGKNAWI